MITTDDLDDLDRVADEFAEHVGSVLFDPLAGESADGDLQTRNDLLAEARTIGLAADPTGDDPGHDYGIWGGHVRTDGLGLSLRNLATLGATCAGFAAAIHAHGIGVSASRPPGRPPVTNPAAAPIAAVFVPPYGTTLDPRTHANAIRIDTSGPTPRLSGRSSFVWSPDTPASLIVAAHNTDPDVAWMIVEVPATTHGLHVEPAGQRVGLRAVDQFQVCFDEVVVEATNVMATGDAARSHLSRIVAYDWLGCAAIALGTARAAHRQAQDYARSRRQGGAAIVDHAAVRLLLGGAAHHIATLEALLARHPATPGGSIDDTTLLTWAIDARLGILEHAAVAVTDSLQTHGGYGYMDDYGLSKRLRDVHALASRNGSREQLLLLRHALDAHRSQADGQ